MRHREQIYGRVVIVSNKQSSKSDPSRRQAIDEE